MKAPVTDKTLGVYVGRANETKFADVRKKARDEYIERCKKRKKNKTVPVPKYKPGDLVVGSMSDYARKRGYVLIEIVDLVHAYDNEFYYFGIVLKASIESANRIGRLVRTGGWSGYDIVPVPVDSIKWLEDQA
jgi:hypothetical protein